MARLSTVSLKNEETLCRSGVAVKPLSRDQSRRRHGTDAVRVEESHVDFACGFGGIAKSRSARGC
jgi:hypothetical protein